jgi:hypothetical protein
MRHIHMALAICWGSNEGTWKVLCTVPLLELHILENLKIYCQSIKAHSRHLSWARLIHSTPSYPNSFPIHFNPFLITVYIQDASWTIAQQSHCIYLGSKDTYFIFKVSYTICVVFPRTCHILHNFIFCVPIRYTFYTKCKLKCICPLC